MTGTLGGVALEAMHAEFQRLDTDQQPEYDRADDQGENDGDVCPSTAAAAAEFRSQT